MTTERCGRCGEPVREEGGRLVDDGGSAYCGGDPSRPHVPESD